MQKQSSESSQGQESKQKVRLLKQHERHQLVKAINKSEIMSQVFKVVPVSLVSNLFPKRLLLWHSIKDSKELATFTLTAIDHYLFLIEKHSKGKEKYAHLYLAWLEYIRIYTCRSKQTLSSLATMALLKRPEISFDIQRTVIASILHAVQDAVQSQMTLKIEALGTESTEQGPQEISADETSLYRISGWALKSCIDNTRKCLKGKQTSNPQLDLLLRLKRPQSDKEYLPKGAKFLDRGGLTFVHSWLLPWVKQIEASVEIYLNPTGFAKYGKDVFHITKESVVKDLTLLQTFTDSLVNLDCDTEFPAIIIEEVHEELLTKFYNARCNEFLKNITKLSCLTNKKAVDVNVGLRDKLKCYAAEKQTRDN